MCMGLLISIVNASNHTKCMLLSLFNMMTGINESKTLTKYVSCECKCKFDERNVIQINGGIAINADVIVKNAMHVKQIIFGILLHVVVKMENI